MNLVAIAINDAAKSWWVEHDDIPPSVDEALGLLDSICEPFRGDHVDFIVRYDAISDFLDVRDPNAPLGRLLAVAFEAPPELIETTLLGWDDGQLWHNEIETRLTERYNFCQDRHPTCWIALNAR